jgi:hypothetical protein
MRTIARSLAGTIVVLLLGPAGAAADPNSRCTHDAWNVDGLPLSVSLCVPGERAPHVVVSETFSRNGQSFARSLEIDVVDGADATRAIDTVPLAEVGSPRSLHLTVAYRNGTASVEHALLLPGAVVLK